MKIHPITVIILGLLLVSIGFNILQSCENDRLRKELNKPSFPIIIDLPDPYPYPDTSPRRIETQIPDHTT